MNAPNQDLISCLNGALSPDANIRRSAENILGESSKNPGYALNLLSISRSIDLPSGIRQLAAVVLRRHIRRSWSPDFCKRDPCTITEGEKCQIREHLPAGLSDTDALVQTATAMVIAEIAKTDCPDHWPQLLPGLVHCITNKNEPSLVSGGVCCLGMLMEDLTESQVLSISTMVLPEVIHIAQKDNYPPSLRCQSLKIFKSSIEAFEIVYKTEVPAKKIVESMLPPWINAIASIINSPTTEECGYLWCVKFEALGCLTTLIPPFSKLIVNELPVLLQAVWNMLSSTLPVYRKVEVGGNDEDIVYSPINNIPNNNSNNNNSNNNTAPHNGIGASTTQTHADDGQRVDLSDLVSQLLELIVTLVSNPRIAKMMKLSFEELSYLTLGYMEMRQDEVDRWMPDPNLYLQEDDSFWGPRASGEMLLDELLDAGGIDAIGAAFQRKAHEASAARADGKEEWWRIHEAVLLGLTAIADRIVDMKQQSSEHCLRAGAATKNKKGAPTLPSSLDPESILPGLLQHDLASGTSPYVAGRALSLLSRWTDILPASLQSTALRASATFLSPGIPGMVQAGACRALAMLCQKAQPHDVHAVSEHAFGALCPLLVTSTEDVLHLVIESITAFVKADPACAARYECHISPPALKAWVENINDPLLEEDAADLLRALANIPACLPALQSRMLPTLCNVISNPSMHSSILVSGCLDMLVVLLAAPSALDTAPSVCAAAIPPTLALLATSSDEDVLASATALLRTTLQVGGEASLSWLGQDAATVITTYLQALEHLLQPSVPDRACRHVGGLIMELLRHAAPAVLPHLGGLVVAVANRLSVADDPATVQSLLSVLAFLAKHDASQLVDLLGQAPGPSPGSNALHVAMQKWTERQIEIRTPYDIRLTTTALGTLLLCPRPELDTIVVRGKRTDTDSSIRTRSRSSQHAEQWRQVPLRVKIIMLLADAFIEAETQGADEGGLGDDEEGDWSSDNDDASDGGSDDYEGTSGAWNSSWSLDQYGGGDFDIDDDVELSNLDPFEVLRRKGDPLSTLDVAGYVSDVFRGMSASAPELLQHAAAELTPVQIEAMRKIWQA